MFGGAQHHGLRVSGNAPGSGENDNSLRRMEEFLDRGHVKDWQSLHLDQQKHSASDPSNPMGNQWSGKPGTELQISGYFKSSVCRGHSGASGDFS